MQHGDMKPNMPVPIDPRVVNSSPTKNNPKKTKYMIDGNASQI